jgi:hypothetical protein
MRVPDRAASALPVHKPVAGARVVIPVREDRLRRVVRRVAALQARPVAAVLNRLAERV